MLPYLAASGHNNYTKSALVYVQQMEELEIKDPDTFQTLMKHHVIRISDRFWAGLSTDLVIEQVLMRNIKTSGGLTRGKGFTEMQRSVWCQAMPYCAAINRAMQKVTDLFYTTSEQHKEAGSSRRNRDYKDIQTIFDFFKERPPFMAVHPLRNIVSGEVAGHLVNVDRAKDIGQDILNSMCGKEAKTWTFKKNTTAKTLRFKGAFTVESEAVHIDQQLLFQRLMFIAERISFDPSRLFTYEMCTFPPSLFDSKGHMLQANKASLADHLWDTYMVPGQGLPQPIPPDVQYVIDGGSLIHRLPWQRGVTFKEIILMYVRYVTSKYKTAIVVFDGYKEGPSTKDATHSKRRAGMSAPEVVFEENNILSTRKELFLSNDKNKQRFITKLGENLAEGGCGVFHAVGDADTLIVSKTVESAKVHPTALVGDDTDLLCILIFHTPEKSNLLYFAPEHKQTSQKAPRLWDIKYLQAQMGSQLSSYILFLHAFTGCDTTSRIYGFGKKQAAKLTNSHTFDAIARVFMSPSEKDEIVSAGEKAMLLLYEGRQSLGASLNEMRTKMFRQKTATSTSYVHARSLPPTESAAHQHSLRVYLQIQTWIRGNETLDPKDWGWDLTDNYYSPIYTDQPPAPADLLKVIRCSCKGDCSSFRCSCRKNGLECSPACGDCRGTSCTNITIIGADDDLEDEDSPLSYDEDHTTGC